MLISEAIAKAKKDIGVSSDDSTIGSRYVNAIMKAVRAELIRQEIEKKGLWLGFPLQTLRSFKMLQLDMGEHKGFNVGVLGFKSAIHFPELMDTKNGKIYGGIFTPNLERINLQNFSQWLVNRDRRYVSNKPSAFLRDRNLYIVNYATDTEAFIIDVDGVYEDPEEVERLNLNNACSPGEDPCVYYPDLEFYMPQYLYGRFFRIVRQELAVSLGIPADNTNDGKSDVQGVQAAAPNHRNNVQDTG